ncbi:DUF2384 domain-containing protein [Ancylobacter dichloromethanicus]|uniref:antitoxin Xre/MbcA/ParS toxin-binding domain-containing protein n=1 Tax=Ancylobacter dichloromethanicus TaxID=518825 RepID=UPI001BCC8F4A|nr:antitoxin Xre/MbcA/ParS toxin-binding domain-containing protein [Ancylobacter dichloromethanicus]MBS7555970.1 DUF2384 domain-containing protein [Ancylobacter dichloromethanicus]
MVAKKGDLQAHHFAHHFDRHGASCTSAGETALHKFAKQVLDERLEIALPELLISHRDDTEVVVRATRLGFDEAVLETKDGSIVPDVVLVLRDRRLIVEFKVTHPCDDVKIARIRAMNVGAIEIDLSAYRDRALDELADDILYNAPRIWLHNPHEPAARDRVSERARQRAEDRQKSIDEHHRNYRHRLPAPKGGSGECEAILRQDGLDALINLPVDGSGCFSVPLAEWQGAIVLGLLESKSQPFRTRTAVAALVRRNWIDPHFRSVSEDIAKALKEAGLPFASPAKSVESYLRQLEQLGFVHSAPSEIWKASGPLRQRIREADELRARPAKRLAELRGIVSEQLVGLPDEETRDFSFEAWILADLSGRVQSVADAIHGSDPEWTALCHQLSNIRTRIRFSPRADLELLGLPCEGELARALQRKRLEAEDREREKREKEKADAEARVVRLSKLAAADLGEGYEIWLRTGDAALNGQSPLESAQSETGLRDALHALGRKADQLRIEEQARERRHKAVRELEALARNRYIDPARADLWMRSSRPELGGQSPANFAIDDATRDKCATYLPGKKSRY